MSSIPTHQAISAQQDALAGVDLVDWPVRASGRDGLLFWGVGLALCLLIMAANGVPWGLASLAIWSLAMWRFWVPVRYTLNAAGITIRSWRSVRRIAWRSIRRYEVRGQTVVCWTVADPTPLDALRCVHLPCARSREEVVALFERYLGPAAAKGDHG